MHLLKITSVALAALSMLSALKAETYESSSVAMGGTGYVTGILTHPLRKGAIFARTDVGGMYAWNQTGAKWEQMLDWVGETDTGAYGVDSFALDPKDSNKVYAFVGTGYWKLGGYQAGTAILRGVRNTTTGKWSWNKTMVYTDGSSTLATTDKQFKTNGNAAAGRGSGDKLAVDPSYLVGGNNLLFVGTRNSGLFKSTDSGATWKSVAGLNFTDSTAITCAAGVTGPCYAPALSTADGNGIAFVAFAPKSEAAGKATQTVVAGLSMAAPGKPNLYISKDGGTKWVAVAGAPTDVRPYRATVDNGYLYVTYRKTSNTQAGKGVLKFAIDSINAPNVTLPYADITPPNASCFACYSAVTTAYGTYSTSYGGIVVNPKDPLHLVLSTSGAFHFRQPSGRWGDAVLVSRDGGKNWVSVMNYGSDTYSNNGIPFSGATGVHWANGLALDPYPDASGKYRVLVSSGHGIFGADNVAKDGSGVNAWKSYTHGVEEGVITDAISTSGSRLISSMLDYNGFSNVDPDDYGYKHTVGGGSGQLANSEARPNLIAKTNGDLWISTDGAANDEGSATPSWRVINKPDAKSFKGNLAFTADGSVLVYRTDPAYDANKQLVSNSRNKFWFTAVPATVSSTWQPTWIAATGLPIAATDAGVFTTDAVDNTVYFYHQATGRIYVGRPNAARTTLTFTAGALIQVGSGSAQIQSVPGRQGYVVLPMSSRGLFVSKDGGQTAAKVAAIRDASAVSAGPAKACSSDPALYLFGLRTTDATGVDRELLRSDDMGLTWTPVNSDTEDFGSLANGGFVLADRNLYGRVYRSTAGRGLVYHQIAESSTVPVPLACPSSVSGGVANQYTAGTPVVVRGWMKGVNHRPDNFSMEVQGASKQTQTFAIGSRYFSQINSPLPGNYRVRGTVAGANGAALKTTNGTTVPAGDWTYFSAYQASNAGVSYNLEVNRNSDSSGRWLRNGWMSFSLPLSYVKGTAVSLTLNGNGVSRTFTTNSAAKAGLNYADIPSASAMPAGAYTVTLSVGGKVVSSITVNKFSS